ncbi:MAG: ORF6N domain-containing protein [Clostridium paraputrificum]
MVDISDRQLVDSCPTDSTKEILNRYLTIVNDPIKEKFNTPIKEKFKDNNTLINNTSNNKKGGQTMNNQIIKINNTDLSVKELKGQRVVTFKDIDMLHERVEGTARKNFGNNKKHFILGEDYIVIKPSDVNNFPIPINNAGLTLITESGYLMLVKSLQDDLAWRV